MLKIKILLTVLFTLDFSRTHYENFVGTFVFVSNFYFCCVPVVAIFVVVSMFTSEII